LSERIVGRKGVVMSSWIAWSRLSYAVLMNWFFFWHWCYEDLNTLLIYRGSFLRLCNF